ncbi:cupin [Austwickia sp. TVS 96-490-7B]|uniref:cupin domain-containing protein n=1 Tax=Austwickia sp. TVS 96-490-7B TaxID=2830843 RepID=UPI001C59C49E|nr:cupin [Austwickia sp. TVS 96-490-7B]
MPELITKPVRVPAPGGKTVVEHLGRQSTGHEAVSVAHIHVPPGWDQPFQTPEFDEVTLVLTGTVLVDHDGGQAVVRAGQSLIARAGERIRYSVGESGAEFIAICLPAFSPTTAHRESRDER